MAGPVRVLTIDGGGIRGVIPAAVLAEIEDRTGLLVPDLFDLVAGTSTGGIIALGLTMPGPTGAPRWRAADLLGLYRREGQAIFSRSVWQRIRSAEGVLDEKYPADGLEAALERYFGDARLRDALTHVLVPAYDLERRKPFFFRSTRAAADPAYDFPTREAARATSAAPTYFEPPELVNDADGQRYALVDGGVFANNPSMCAYAEILAEDRAADVLMVSLGTGQLNRPIHYADAKDWGLLGWARPILEVVFDGVSDTTDYELEQLLGPERHVRLQIELVGASDNLDDATPENIANLERKARELIAEHDEEIARVCTALVDRR
jgi:patatin-like phospholipase/acyl hydrolase